MPSEPIYVKWVILGIVCVHAHMCLEGQKSPFMLQGRGYTLVRQGGKHFDGFVVYSIKNYTIIWKGY